MFDYYNFTTPFYNFGEIQQNFGNNQVWLINSLEEAEELGIKDNGFMNSIPYYHLSQYYSYIGGNAPLYICFASSSSGWSVIETMQAEANGRLFQIGIWTTRNIWAVSNGTIGFTSLLGDIESAVEEVSGKIGKSSIHSAPLSVMVSPNTYLYSSVDNALRSLPDGTALECPKVSVCLMQNGTDTVHSMQSKNYRTAPVGCIGLLMACLYKAAAEESVGCVKNFNLNVNEDVEDAEIPIGDAFFKVGDISYAVGNLIAQKGYIIPTTYDGRESEVFFSGDPTLSDGDYSSITNNRIIHKCRRAVNAALLPYVGSHHLVTMSTANGQELNASSASMIQDSIINSMDSRLINASTKTSQITSREISISASSDILNDDTLKVTINIVPVNSDSVIEETVEDITG